MINGGGDTAPVRFLPKGQAGGSAFAAVMLVFAAALPAAPHCAAAPPDKTEAEMALVEVAPGGTLPPPGRYVFLKGDTLLLNPFGADPASRVLPGSEMAAVRLEGDGRVEAPDGARGCSRAVDRSGMHSLFLGGDGMYAWLAADRAREDYGAGITHLTLADYPYSPVFLRPNLNFEHIMNGAEKDYDRSMDSPRRDPMTITAESARSVLVRWPAATASWGLECAMRYTLSGDNAVDMEFSVTPLKDEAPLGYLVFMWASYMHSALGREIYFPGVEKGREGWVTFGADQPGGAYDTGTIAFRGAEPLAFETGADMFNLVESTDKFFTLPVYYGLIDGNMIKDEPGDTTAFIMMFDNAGDTRFAMWDWGGNHQTPAWDWQFVVRNPEPGKTYRHRSRLLLKPFVSHEDIIAEYEKWRDTPPASSNPDSMTPFSSFDYPVIWSSQEKYYEDLTPLANIIAQDDPDRALALYRRVAATCHRLSAAECIDEWYLGRNDPVGLLWEWRELTGRSDLGETGLGRLAAAWERLENWAMAAAVWSEAAERRPSHAPSALNAGRTLLWAGQYEAGTAQLARAAEFGGEIAGSAADILEGCAQKAARDGYDGEAEKMRALAAAIRNRGGKAANP